ncbi:MAG: Uma2 family endonuclease [Phaeodactylibacter sp.]|nr:Uma2 family endonuclease [Phaeodactylibacter sp.]
METTTKKITYQEFRQMEFDEDDRFFYELLNGELVKKSAPSALHQRISGRLFSKIRAWIDEKGLGELFYAPIDVFLDDYNAPQPDLVFIKKTRLGIVHLDNGIVGIPDLVVEILSPTSIKRDRFEKMEIYQRFNPPEYWIVDPANGSIEVYTLKNDKLEIASFAAQEGAVQSPALGGLEIEVEKIFE